MCFDEIFISMNVLCMITFSLHLVQNTPIKKTAAIGGAMYPDISWIDKNNCPFCIVDITGTWNEVTAQLSTPFPSAFYYITITLKHPLLSLHPHVQ